MQLFSDLAATENEFTLALVRVLFIQILDSTINSDGFIEDNCSTNSVHDNIEHAGLPQTGTHKGAWG